MRVRVCVRALRMCAKSGRVMLAGPSRNMSVSCPFVFFSLSPTRTHTYTHRHADTWPDMLMWHHSITATFTQTHMHTKKQMCISATVITRRVSLFLPPLFHSFSQLKIHYFKSFFPFYLCLIEIFRRTRFAYKTQVVQLMWMPSLCCTSRIVF